MRMSVSRFAEVSDGPDSVYLSEVSMRFAGSFAQSMQALGVCGVRVEKLQSLSGRACRLADVALFDFAPPESAKYARGTMEQSAGSLVAFGVSEIRLSPEDGDRDVLDALWSQLRGDPVGLEERDAAEVQL